MILLINDRSKTLVCHDKSGFYHLKFFRPIISKVTIIKTKSATIAIFIFSSFLPLVHSFLLSFSFAGVIFEVIGAQKTYLLAFVRSDESTFRWVRLRKRRAYNLAEGLISISPRSRYANK